MLRSLPKDLLTYTCEGVLIRTRYVRQLDNIYKTELAAKHAAKKIIRDFNSKLEEHDKKIANQAYSKGLRVLLGDILNFVVQYQEKLTQYEFQQREQLIAVVAQLFDSPEIQTELTHRLISTIPSEKKITLDIPITLRRYIENKLNKLDIELISHESKTIAVHAGDQITFFDPTLLIDDLKAQFHRPYTESYQPVFTQEIKEILLKYINTFDVFNNISSQSDISSENNEDED
ncbi:MULTISPECIES: type III secretion protein [Proteus]|uniref:type III secretion protein n=1 Tax=Proteus TaxID=583 RepID=UPI000BFD5E66|nr:MULTISPECIES: type III secretion protein [Proteus]ATM99323.1 type III secretion protein [Proteus vulgaris]MBG2837681.1 type III secretion protein [Proteus terrae subsp. cibarius]MBG2868052.1 type III secretion protein [Proteus terrae subsp. cibarius]MBJ2110023.1 type III secretion protein [Proteus terrae]MBJ2133951.1 type III secretion protein [Proteus terrae]